MMPVKDKQLHLLGPCERNNNSCENYLRGIMTSDSPYGLSSEDGACPVLQDPDGAARVSAPKGLLRGQYRMG